MAQYTGKVMWFNNAKGYGFLNREGGPDVFLHYSAIVGEGYKTLREGEEVTFDVIQGSQGQQAADVQRVSTGYAQGARQQTLSTPRPQASL